LLQKGRDYFIDDEKKIVTPLFKHSTKRERAYNDSHRLSSTFNSYINKDKATELFRQWISDASASNLKCFKTFLCTFNKYMKDITNEFMYRHSSGFVEGFNLFKFGVV
jgi:transposase